MWFKNRIFSRNFEIFCDAFFGRVHYSTEICQNLNFWRTIKFQVQPKISDLITLATPKNNEKSDVKIAKKIFFLLKFNFIENLIGKKFGGEPPSRHRGHNLKDKFNEKKMLNLKFIFFRWKCVYTQTF